MVNRFSSSYNEKAAVNRNFFSRRMELLFNIIVRYYAIEYINENSCSLETSRLIRETMKSLTNDLERMAYRFVTEYLPKKHLTRKEKVDLKTHWPEVYTLLKAAQDYARHNPHPLPSWEAPVLVITLPPNMPVH